VEYWVNVMPPSRRARVHSSNCHDFDDAQIQAVRDKQGSRSYWVGPHDSLVDAETYMRRLKYADTGRCTLCVRRVLT